MNGATGTPGRKKRENNFHDPGIRGRKTGLVLKDTGIRDKDGLEPIDGIFSSPEKSIRQSRKSNATLTSSEDMEVGQSSAPDPADVLTGRKLARESFAGRPPPAGRSPIKTNIGATPRRQSSMAPRSSPQRTTPAARRASSQPTVNRLLDFSMTESRRSVESGGRRSATRSPVRSAARTASRNTQMFDLSESREGSAALDEADEEQVETNVMDDIEEEDETQANDTYGESPAPAMDDVLNGIDDDDAELIEEEMTKEATELAQEDEPPTKKRGRGRRSNASAASGVAAEDEGDLSDPPKRNGRPAKKDATSVEADSVAEIEEPPRKRTRRSYLQESHDALTAPEPEPEVEQEHEVPKVAKGKGTKAKKPPPSKKDANAKITSKSAKAAARSHKGGFTKPSFPHGIQRLRAETPVDGEGVKHTRSGRASLKPLNYWKGERAVFKTDKNFVDTIDAIIRVEDVTPMKRTVARSQARPRKKRRVTVFQDDAEEEEDDEEQWEMDEGVINGPVRSWDADLTQGIDDGAEQEIAYAASHIEARDVAEASFRFAKTLTMPFFGSGIVELPPGGFKHRKNTRRMQMVFFVHYGKVTVEVGATRFVITKGGMWQVPRGNFYSISNETDQDAKIFFSQGCEVAPEPVDMVDPEHLETTPAA